MPMDLSKLSDEDLIALQKGDVGSVSDEGLAHLDNQANLSKRTPDPDSQPNPFQVANGQDEATALLRKSGKDTPGLEDFNKNVLDKMVSPEGIEQMGYNALGIGGIGAAANLASKAPSVATAVASKVIPGVGGIMKILKIGKAILPEAESAAPAIEDTIKASSSSSTSPLLQSAQDLADYLKSKTK